MVGGPVFDALADDIQIVQFGTQGAGNGPCCPRILAGQHFSSTSRVVIGARFDPALQKEPIALGQGLGMGINHTDFTEARLIRGQQAMVHGDFDFADHLQIRGGQQVVDLGNGAFQRIFHRYDAQVEIPFLYPFEDIEKFEAGDKRHAGRQASGGDLTVSPMLTLERHQLAVLLLQALALLNDGSQQLAGK